MYKLLVKQLEKHGYFAIPLTNGLFAHKTLPTKFALCVNDFGIKKNLDQDLHHLIATLKKYYDISIDKEGLNYCRLTFDWHYRVYLCQQSLGSVQPSNTKSPTVCTA